MWIQHHPNLIPCPRWLLVLNTGCLLNKYTPTIYKVSPRMWTISCQPFLSQKKQIQGRQLKKGNLTFSRFTFFLFSVLSMQQGAWIKRLKPTKETEAVKFSLTVPQFPMDWLKNAWHKAVIDKRSSTELGIYTSSYHSYGLRHLSIYPLSWFRFKWVPLFL